MASAAGPAVSNMGASHMTMAEVEFLGACCCHFLRIPFRSGPITREKGRLCIRICIRIQAARLREHRPCCSPALVAVTVTALLLCNRHYGAVPNNKRLKRGEESVCVCDRPTDETAYPAYARAAVRRTPCAVAFAVVFPPFPPVSKKHPKIVRSTIPHLESTLWWNVASKPIAGGGAGGGVRSIYAIENIPCSSRHSLTI